MSLLRRRMTLLGRSAAAAPWDPLDEASLLWWLDASDLSSITKDGSNLVTEWRDKAPGGFEVTTAGPPTWLASGLNGRPAVEVTGQGMLGAFAHAANEASVFMVGTLINGGSSSGPAISFAATGVASTGAGGWNPVKRNATTEAINSAHAGSSQASNAVTYTTPWLRTSMRDAATIYFGLNGATVSTAAVSFTTDYDLAALGANITSGGVIGTVFGHFRIAEIVMFGVKVATALQQQIEGYLAHRWGIALASGHPYQFSPP